MLLSSLTSRSLVVITLQAQQQRQEDSEAAELEQLDAELTRLNADIRRLKELKAQALDRRAALLRRRDKADSAASAAAAQAPGPEAFASSDGFPWSAEAGQLLCNRFRLTEFRPLQLQAINATMSGRDCLLVMPTGAGKSLCYQLPALLSNGLTLCVSPLVSLMEDQVMALDRLGVPAVQLSAGCAQSDTKRAFDEASAGRLRLLYATPERLAKSRRLMAGLEKLHGAGRLSRVAIDEVHCCSQWGHDFRPDYKFLGVLRRQFPGVPTIGLTATASDRVLADVRDMLGLSGDCLLLRGGFDRPNLLYRVLPKPADSMQAVADLIRGEFANQSGIVYCCTQREAEQLTDHLRTRNRLPAACYHASLDARTRAAAHTDWLSGRVRVVVATVAFGMGIDKPDVRFVIHHTLSKSPETYYQESGRAGRDGQPAQCLLLYRLADVFRLSPIVFAERTGLPKLYDMLRYCTAGDCRRRLLARHLEAEAASSTSATCQPIVCRAMCDWCGGSQPPAHPQWDLAGLGGLIADLLAEAGASKRLTAMKVVESLCTGRLAARSRSVLPPGAPLRPAVEAGLVELLLRGYLTEDFHFTPFATVPYLAWGPRQLGPGDLTCPLPAAAAVSANGDVEAATAAQPARKRQRVKKRQTDAADSDGSDEGAADRDEEDFV